MRKKKMSEEIINKRSEIVFLYDIKDANPNGDPADGNKPRTDEATGHNIVTDVRLKRTIRDYLYKFKKEEIFVRKIPKDDNSIQTAKERAEDFESDPDKIIKDCIDIRLFGGTIPLAKKSEKTGESSITYTGPVQFGMGRSLHRVELKHIKGTGAFASTEGKAQQTFREEWILPYSLIGFHGIINENAADDTKLKESDVKALLDGMWNGTTNLITRSKKGQIPRLLLQVIYKEDNFHLGELKTRINLQSKKEDEELRDPEDYFLELENLIATLEDNKDKIEYICYKVNDRLQCAIRGEIKAFDEILGDTGINTEEITF